LEGNSAESLEKVFNILIPDWKDQFIMVMGYPEFIKNLSEKDQIGF